MSFRPLTSTNAISQNYGQINDMVRQLNNEQITKAFKQSGGNSVISGKLPYGGYGTLYYGSDNIPYILIGQHPTDGHMGMWMSKSGLSVIDELSA